MPAKWNYTRRLEPLFEKLDDQGPAGETGAAGPAGAAGVGVPAGGTANQVLKKNSTTDYDTSWTTPTLVQSGRVMSDAAGAGSWFYPTAYGAAPNVVAVCEGNATVYLTATPGTASVSFQTSVPSTWVQLIAKGT